MKKIFFFLTIFISGFSVSAQSTGDIRERRIKSVYSQVTDSRKKNEVNYKRNLSVYDKHANVIESIDFNGDSVIIKHEKFTFNNHNDETGYWLLDASGKILKHTQTSYNKWKNEKQKLIYEGNDKLVEKTDYGYDNMNNKISETTSDASGNMIRTSYFEYDKKGMITAKKTYNEKKEAIYSRQIQYTY